VGSPGLIVNTQFSAISWREQAKCQWDDDDIRLVLDIHAELDLCKASSLKQQFAGRHVGPLGHIILISSQPVLFSFSPKIMLLSWPDHGSNLMIGS
jgi:hypothetical protein